MNERRLAWDDLALFLAVARGGGLSPAARSTGKSAATLGRRMLALERQLDTELFVRHERGYALTDSAEGLLEELGEIEARINRLAGSVPSGQLPRVKLSAGTWTTLFLIQHLERLIGTPPDLRLRFVSTEVPLDIPRREIAIGFRNRRPSERGLAGRKLAPVKFAPYARSDAIDRWIGVLADTPSARWLTDRSGGHTACEVSSPRNALDLAIAGHGRVVLPMFIGEGMAQLRRVAEPIAELAHDQWLVLHEQDRHLPETRRVIERIYTLFR